MKKLLSQYENKEPEIVFEWNDTQTEARGWVVINSLRGGAAGGGTRMRQGLNKHEVISLAKKQDDVVAVKLHVHTNNKSAIKAYEKAGMKRTPEYPYIFNLK